MNEEEFYEKIIDAEVCNFQGEIHEFLKMTKKEYREQIHCKYCKRPKWKRKYCEPYNPYCCSMSRI